MKTIFTLAALSFCTWASAYEITCDGQRTKASIVLELADSAFPLVNADYLFKGKVIPKAGYHFEILGDREKHTQRLVYKFTALKRHGLAKKNSNLVLTIDQSSEEIRPFIFILDESYVAELARESFKGELTFLDKMTCSGI